MRTYVPHLGNNGLSDQEILALFDENCFDPSTLLDSEIQLTGNVFPTLEHSNEQIMQSYDTHQRENNSPIDLEMLEFFDDNRMYPSDFSSFAQTNQLSVDVLPEENSDERSMSLHIDLFRRDNDESVLNPCNENKSQNNAAHDMFFLDMSDFSLLQIKTDDIANLGLEPIGKLNVPSLIRESQMNENDIKNRAFLCGETSKMMKNSTEEFTRPKTYCCHYCSKKFYNKMASRRHQLCHSKKMLKCSYCQHRARSSSGLVRHLEYYHCYSAKRQKHCIFFDSL